MPSPFHPEGLHRAGTSLVHGQAVGEVDDLVFGPVDHQHRRGDFRDLVNAGGYKGEQGSVWGCKLHIVKESLAMDTRSSCQGLLVNGCKMLELCPGHREQGSKLTELALPPPPPHPSSDKPKWAACNPPRAVSISITKPTERQRCHGNAASLACSHYTLSPSNSTH